MLKCFILLAVLSYAYSSSYDERIINGKEIDISSAPHIVSLRYKSFAKPKDPFKHHCGGAILSKDTIITAADCVEGNEAKNFVIVTESINTAGGDGIFVPVKRIIIHPEYNYYSIKYNVALLKLSSTLNINEFSSRPIPLAEATPLNGKAILTGFGKESEDSEEQSDILKQVQVSVIDQYICRQLYLPDIISSDMFCAGNLEGNADGCQGDAGSPLVLDGHLIGILSFGRGCGRQGYPSVYTSVAHVYNWIQKEL